jgi:hypothetical protein
MPNSTLQGQVERKNEYGLKLRGIPGPEKSKGYFNYSKMEFRDPKDVEFPVHNEGDTVTMTVTDTGFIKSLSLGQTIPPAWTQPSAQPPFVQPGQAPAPRYSEAPPDPPDEAYNAPEQGFGAQREYIDREISIERQVCLKAAVEVWLGILPANKGATIEQAVADVIMMATALRMAIRE